MSLVVLGVAISARHTRVPYTVGLVVVGLVIGVIPGHPGVQLTPNLVMLVFLPALLFAGSWTYPPAELRRHWLPIALLSTVGVLISMLVSWFFLTRVVGLPAGTALIFGAIVSATDPVAVLAIFRSVRTDRRLAAIVEGESLFNDATAVAALKVTLLFTLVGTHASAALPIEEFGLLVGGGALVGTCIGLAGLAVLRLTDDYMVEAAGTLVVAYASYYVADRLGASGLLAVIVAGMLLSGVGVRVGSFTTTRQGVNQLWEFIAFVANSMLFLLVGLSINVRELFSTLAVAALGIVAVAIARIVAVYGLGGLSGLLGHKLPLTWQHVLVLGGLRGALPMALALSLPQELAQRDVLISMVFSVVLFTLVVQGLVLAPALVRLRLQSAEADH